MLEKGFDYWLKKLERFLRECRGVQIKKKTPHSVQFTYNDLIEVDLLVSPWWDSVVQLTEFLDKVPVEKRFR